MYYRNWWTTIDDAEDLHLFISMYNLFEYSSNYSEATASLWFHLKDEATNFNADIANTNNFKFFKYKAKRFGNSYSRQLLKTLKKFKEFLMITWNAIS